MADTGSPTGASSVCIDVPVETAVARAIARSGTEPTWSHRIEPDAVRHLASIFEPPTAEEGVPIHTVGTSTNSGGYTPVQ